MKKEIAIKLKVIGLVLLLVMVSTLTAFADDLDENKEKQEDVKSRIAIVEEETLAQKAVVDELQKSIDELQTQIAELEAQIAQKEKDIEETKLAISDREDGLGQRLRVMYRNGSIGFLDVILKSNDISEFLSNIAMLQRIYKNDADLLDQLEEKHRRLKSEEAELKEAREILEHNKAEVAAQKAQADAEMEALDAKMKELEEELENLEEEEEALRRRLRSYTWTGGSYYNGGYFGWPCTGTYIADFFEVRVHPILGYLARHNGVDIPAAYGTPIFAAEDGVVIISDWYGVYGYAVMIQHTDSLVTLYGHNSTLLVNVGEKVTRGQTIALCGSTGWSTGPHCHFEVRLNGEAVDPLNYLNY